jgi:hypothetical protein
MNRPSVDPSFTFGVSLVISLVLWYPTLRATMSGNIEITDSGIRYFLALAIAWAGVYGISAIVAMYASKPRDLGSPAPTPPPAAREPVPARRQGEGAPDETASEAADSNAA